MNSGYDSEYSNAGVVHLYLGPIEGSINLQSGVDADLTFTPEIAQTAMTRLWAMNMDDDPEDEIFILTNNAGFFRIDNGLLGLGTITNNSVYIIRSESWYGDNNPFL